jgi:hypothetical protein
MTEAIRRLVGGFIGGDVPTECFSPDFGVHEGLSLQEWIAHERREFEMRRQAFGIATEALSIRIDHRRQPDCITFSVMGAQGRVAYQDTWMFDADGRMIGNGSRFEIVAKLHFDASGSPLRALAVRSAKGSIVSVVPIGVAASEAVLNQGMRAEVDDFATFTMAVENDDLRGFRAKFRIADDAGVRSTEAVWMRGVDEAGFTHGLFPRIDGRAVIVPGEGPSWSLSVVLADGSRQAIDHPQPGSYEFVSAVETAILTDALDNDWLSSAQ